MYIWPDIVKRLANRRQCAIILTFQPMRHACMFYLWTINSSVCVCLWLCYCMYAVLNSARSFYNFKSVHERMSVSSLTHLQTPPMRHILVWCIRARDTIINSVECSTRWNWMSTTDRAARTRVRQSHSPEMHTTSTRFTKRDVGDDGDRDGDCSRAHERARTHWYTNINTQTTGCKHQPKRLSYYNIIAMRFMFFFLGDIIRCTWDGWSAAHACERRT